MLKVQSISSIFTPGASIGTRNAVIPSASPALPPLRAKTRSWEALCTPVFQVFSPLIRQPSPSRRARVSMWVASDP